VATAVLLAWAPWSAAVNSGASVPSLAVPAGYHIVYAVSVPGQPRYIEQIWVLRPFESVDQSGAVTTVYRLGAEVVKNQDNASLVAAAAAPAPNDVRLDSVLSTVMRTGRLLMLGSQTVAGLSCRVFRSAAPLTSGPLPVLSTAKSAANNYVDTCVDGDGLVLEETTVSGGHVTEIRQALSASVGTAAAATPAFDTAAAPTPFDLGGGAFTALTLSSRPPVGPFWQPATSIVGFQHAGRYAVVPSQPQAFSDPASAASGSAGLPPSLVSEIDDVWVQGPNTVVLQQGSTIGPSHFQPPNGGERVDVGALGTGQLLISATGTTLDIEPDGGSRFLRITGTVPPEVLVGVARSLQLQSPGTLVDLSAHPSGQTP
jgi:hypothetical protein